MKLVTKNKSLKVESKKLAKELTSSKYQLKSQEQVINILQFKLTNHDNNLTNVHREIKELKIGCDVLKKEK